MRIKAPFALAAGLGVILAAISRPGPSFVCRTV